MNTQAASLLIVAHTPSPNTRNLANALLEGAQRVPEDSVISTLESPFDVDFQQVSQADALVLFTTENFGYMSGALKDLFERIYYPCLADSARNEAKPYALVIRAGLDGTGTDRSVHKIIQGLKWREVQSTLLCQGEHQTQFIEQCQTLGETMAASLAADIY